MIEHATSCVNTNQCDDSPRQILARQKGDSNKARNIYENIIKQTLHKCIWKKYKVDKHLPLGIACFLAKRYNIRLPKVESLKAANWNWLQVPMEQWVVPKNCGRVPHDRIKDVGFCCEWNEKCNVNGSKSSCIKRGTYRGQVHCKTCTPLFQMIVCKDVHIPLEQCSSNDAQEEWLKNIDAKEVLAIEAMMSLK